MRPVLVDLGPLELKSWGLMVAIALLLAGVALRSELERLSGRGEVASSLVVAAGLGGLVGARLYWLAEHAGEASLGDSFSGAGFTWYGGLLGGVAAVVLVARLRGVPIRALLDAAAPALALGYGVGRIACQLAGDGTYGVASDLPWAMSYPHGEVPTTERVHPTPVYETLASLIIFWFLWRMRKRAAPLQIFGLYLVLAGAERFVVEFIRLNEPVLVGLTQPQIWAAAMILIGLVVLAWRRAFAEDAPRGPAVATDLTTTT